MSGFSRLVSNICLESNVQDFQIYNGSLFYKAPVSVSRKLFSNLMQAFDMKCQIKLIELDYYVVDFVE